MPSLCSCASKFVRARVPDGTSLLALLLTALLAVGVTLAWLVFTIQKWQHAIANPVRSVSYETAEKLPCFFGLLVANNYWITDAMRNMAGLAAGLLFTATWPLECWDWRGRLTVDMLAAHSIHIDLAYIPGFRLTTQMSEPGRPWLDPARAPAGELDGHSARQNDLFPISSAPLYFDSADSIACFGQTMLVNKTAVHELNPRAQFTAPASLLAMMTSEQTLAALQVLQLDPVRDAELIDAMVLEVSTHISVQATMLWEHSYTLMQTPTRTIRVDGSEVISYEYVINGPQPMTDALRAQAWQGVLEGAFLQGGEAARQQLLYLAAQPGVEVASLSFCTSPASMEVRVVRDEVNYGWVSFVTEVGGFISLLSFVLLLLFPVTNKPLYTRAFLPLFIKQLLQQQDRHQMRKLQEHTPDAVELAAIEQHTTRGKEVNPAAEHPLGLPPSPSASPAYTFAAAAAAAAAASTSESASPSLNPALVMQQLQERVQQQEVLLQRQGHLLDELQRHVRLGTARTTATPQGRGHTAAL